MFDFQLPENLTIFLDNLSIYHVFFDLFSLFTIIFTWWYCKSNNVVPQDINENDEGVGVETSESSINSTDTQMSEKDQSDYNVLNWTDDNVVSNIKILRQKALVKELQSKLTMDELEEEKKTEMKQLEKIFQLLQDQKDKFQMTSMEQLQDQLQLYRI